MISRINRFHGQASLRRMQQNNTTVRGGMLSIKYATNPRRSKYRLAVVVSKKISKSAVVRNRIRRRIYESVRILSSEFIAAYDVVVIVYDQKLATIPADQLTQEVTKLFQKAKLTTANTSVHGIVHTKENS